MLFSLRGSTLIFLAISETVILWRENLSPSHKSTLHQPHATSNSKFSKHPLNWTEISPILSSTQKQGNSNTVLQFNSLRTRISLLTTQEYFRNAQNMSIKHCSHSKEVITKFALVSLYTLIHSSVAFLVLFVSCLTFHIPSIPRSGPEGLDYL